MNTLKAPGYHGWTHRMLIHRKYTHHYNVVEDCLLQYSLKSWFYIHVYIEFSVMIVLLYSCDIVRFFISVLDIW